MTALRPSVRALMKLFYRQALPSTVREHLRIQRGLAQREREPQLIGAPENRRILVLAPHMDDEVLGCGGTLMQAAARGSEIRVAYLTDGRRGYDPARLAGFGAGALQAFEENLVQTRKAEAQRAGRLLGFATPIFLDLPDGSVATAADAAERVASALHEARPEVIFLPFMTDPHPDHWGTNRAFIEAASVGGLDPALPCWGYEVWAPLVANTFVDVSDAMTRKLEAVAAFESQNIDVDYPRVIEALNTYRSLAAGVSHGFAEAFFVETLSEYSLLFRSGWPNRLPSPRAAATR